MVITSLAWNLTAWPVLWTAPRPGRWHEKHSADQEEMLRTESLTFISFFIRIPCQIINTGRMLLYRLLAWNAWQYVFYRMASQPFGRSAAAGLSLEARIRALRSVGAPHH
jgi:hypothetical protein